MLNFNLYHSSSSQRTTRFTCLLRFPLWLKRPISANLSTNHKASLMWFLSHFILLTISSHSHMLILFISDLLSFLRRLSCIWRRLIMHWFICRFILNKWRYTLVCDLDVLKNFDVLYDWCFSPDLLLFRSLLEDFLFWSIRTLLNPGCLESYWVCLLPGCGMKYDLVLLLATGVVIIFKRSAGFRLSKLFKDYF